MEYSVKFKGMDPIPAIVVFSEKKEVDSYADLNVSDKREILEIRFKDLTDFELLMSAYRSDEALSEITIIDTNGTDEFIYYDYIIRISLAFTSVESSEIATAENQWIMKLAQLTETDKRLRQIVDTINKSPATMTLEEYKVAKIEQSKELLEKFLYYNPLITSAKNDIFAEYTATTDKQNQFVGQFVSYYFNTQMGIEVNIYWNERGKPCSVWTVEQGLAFMNAMKAYTKPLVTAQQQFEVNINACTTKAEVEATNINYASVPTANGRSWWVGYTADEVRRLIEHYGDTEVKPDDADAYLNSEE